MQQHKVSRQDRERAAMRQANSLPQPSLVDIDPEDPTQLLDEAGQFSIVDTDLDAQPQAEADAELDAALAAVAGEEDGEDDAEVAAANGDEDARELDTPSQTAADAYIEAADDTGDLYGVHMPPAADPDLDINRDGESFKDSDLGEHAFETLEKKMAENGAEPEHEIDVTDDSDIERGHHKSDNRDRPVADKGSGGNAGM
jgi:hypothetical protein